MGGLEHRLVLDANPDQAIDVEEAAPVCGVTGAAPPGQAIMLVLQQPVQPFAASLCRSIERTRRRGSDLGLVFWPYREPVVIVANQRLATVAHQGELAV